jgi:hypothetical protein
MIIRLTTLTLTLGISIAAHAQNLEQTDILHRRTLTPEGIQEKQVYNQPLVYLTRTPTILPENWDDLSSYTFKMTQDLSFNLTMLRHQLSPKKFIVDGITYKLDLSALPKNINISDIKTLQVDDLKTAYLIKTRHPSAAVVDCYVVIPLDTHTQVLISFNNAQAKDVEKLVVALVSNMSLLRRTDVQEPVPAPKPVTAGYTPFYIGGEVALNLPATVSLETGPVVINVRNKQGESIADVLWRVTEDTTLDKPESVEFEPVVRKTYVQLGGVDYFIGTTATNVYMVTYQLGRNIRFKTTTQHVRLLMEQLDYLEWTPR